MQKFQLGLFKSFSLDCKKVKLKFRFEKKNASNLTTKNKKNSKNKNEKTSFSMILANHNIYFTSGKKKS